MVNNRIGKGSEGDLLAGRDSFRCPATVIPTPDHLFMATECGVARTIAYAGKYSRREEKNGKKSFGFNGDDGFDADPKG